MSSDDGGTKKATLVRKICLRLPPEEHIRLNKLRVGEDLTWEGLLSASINLWLAQRGKKELKGL